MIDRPFVEQFAKPDLDALSTMGSFVRIAVIDRTKMLHSADNVRFGEAALRHCDRRSMSPLGRL